MQNFDDLDIEGRNPSHQSEEDREKEDHDRKRLMRTSVTAEDGTLRPVYSETEDGDIWCHICNIALFGAHKLLSHNICNRHKIKLDEWPYPVLLWSKNSDIVNKNTGTPIQGSLARGEPIPPGMEDQIARNTTIQVSLDRHRSSPLVGLEYLLELVDNDSCEPCYTCVLCDKRGDPRTVMAHITSYNHRIAYLNRHFPTISRAITELPRTPNYKRGANEISVLVAKKIEDHFGRLQPQLVDKGQFEKNKMQYIKRVYQDVHFRETQEFTLMEIYDVRWVTNFEEKMAEVTKETKKEVPPVEDMKEDKKEEKQKEKDREKDRKRDNNRDEKEKEAKKRDSRSDKESKSNYKIRILTKDKVNKKVDKPNKKVDKPKDRSAKKPDDLRSLSSLSSISSSPSPVRPRSKSPSRSRGKKFPHFERNYRSRRNIRHSRSRSRSVELVKQRDKWDKYKEQIRRAEETLERALKFHEKNPEKHPSYPDEWKKFWNRRYKELQSEGKDPSKHNFKPEWIEFWNKRMRELHVEQVEQRKEEIRKRLELPEEKPPEKIPSTSTPNPSKKKETTPTPKRRHQDSDDDVEYVGTTKSIKPDYHLDRHEMREKEREREREQERERERERERARQRERDRDLDRGRELDRGRDLDRGIDLERGRDYYLPYSRGGVYRTPPAHAYYGPPRTATARPRYHASPYPVIEKSPSPISDEILSEDLEIVGVLRLLTALEGQLGSLGPKIVSLLSKALAAEKLKPNSAEELLYDEEVSVMFETVKEKLKGQLFAGMIEKKGIAPTKTAIQNIAQLLHKAAENKKKMEEEKKKHKELLELSKSMNIFNRTYPRVDVPSKILRSEPVSVPGVGTVDKVAIAQQIAAALVAQGRSNVSQEELETLINAVVGMAEASKQSNKPVTTADFVRGLTGGAKSPVPPVKEHSFSPLSLSPSPLKKPAENSVESRAKKMESLSDEDLKALLQNFKELGTEEQHGLINFLKKLEATDLARVEKLRAYVNLGTSSAAPLKPKSPSPEIIETVKSRKSASPFSTRKGNQNPTDDENKWKPKVDMFADEEENKNDDKKLDFSDDDDDYTFEDIYKAADKNVNENQKAKGSRSFSKSRSNSPKSWSHSRSKSRSRSRSPAKAKESTKNSDPNAILNETKRLIANIMGDLPNKYPSHITTTLSNNDAPHSDSGKNLLEDTSSPYNQNYGRTLTQVNTGGQSSNQHPAQQQGNYPPQMNQFQNYPQQPPIFNSNPGYINNGYNYNQGFNHNTGPFGGGGPPSQYTQPPYGQNQFSGPPGIGPPPGYSQQYGNYPQQQRFY